MSLKHRPIDGCDAIDRSKLSHSAESSCDHSLVDNSDAFCLQAFGVCWGIRGGNQYLIDRFRSRLPLGWQPCTEQQVEHWFSLVSENRKTSDGTCELYTLRADDPGRTVILKSASVEDVLYALDWQFRLTIALNAKELLFVHAGVVGWNDKAIVIPGRSFSGKSTLVATFLRMGATYYSDEYAVFDSAGQVHPYLRPIGLRDGYVESAGFYTAAEFGAESAIGPLKTGIVLATKYRPDAVWSPSRLSSGDMVMAMFANTVAAQARPAFALKTLACVATQYQGHAGDRGDARATVESLITTL